MYSYSNVFEGSTSNNGTNDIAVNTTSEDEPGHCDEITIDTQNVNTFRTWSNGVSGYGIDVTIIHWQQGDFNRAERWGTHAMQITFDETDPSYSENWDLTTDEGTWKEFAFRQEPSGDQPPILADGDMNGDGDVWWDDLDHMTDYIFECFFNPHPTIDEWMDPDYWPTFREEYPTLWETQEEYVYEHGDLNDDGVVNVIDQSMLNDLIQDYIDDNDTPDLLPDDGDDGDTHGDPSDDDDQDNEEGGPT